MSTKKLHLVAFGILQVVAVLEEHTGHKVLEPGPRLIHLAPVPEIEFLHFFYRSNLGSAVGGDAECIVEILQNFNPAVRRFEIHLKILGKISHRKWSTHPRGKRSGQTFHESDFIHALQIAEILPHQPLHTLLMPATQRLLRASNEGLWKSSEPEKMFDGGGGVAEFSRA
ncbi:MAG: hypothetical protein HUU37_07645 [Bdellovibrionales bacterium]|nr:hypothetical protein [Bdellovibrionales bacterium]